jgi:hypothetical protein
LFCVKFVYVNVFAADASLQFKTEIIRGRDVAGVNVKLRVAAAEELDWLLFANTFCVLPLKNIALTAYDAIVAVVAKVNVWLPVGGFM